MTKKKKNNNIQMENKKQNHLKQFCVVVNERKKSKKKKKIKSHHWLIYLIWRKFEKKIYNCSIRDRKMLSFNNLIETTNDDFYLNNMEMSISEI